jgi:imidazolonepropionase
MTSTLYTDIGQLVTNDPAHGGVLGLREHAAVVAEDGVIRWVGSAGSAPAADHIVPLRGRAVIPGFVDSHTHAVFAGERGAEFEARMAGQPYTGGGIASTVASTREATDEQLTARVRALFREMRAQGTTTIEVKSGYGLTVEDEVRQLRIAREVTSETTFLGAHVVPPAYAHDRAAYVALVTGEMLAACAPLARWVDVFCEPGAPTAFDADEARAVLRAGMAAGLMPRVHANQLGHGPGVLVGVEVGAASVDHCTYLSDEDLAALAGSSTVATLLPVVEFSTRQPYPDAARILAAGVTVALATDCNPGTAFSSSMPLALALAVRDMGMSPAQALWSATAGGARALRRTDVGVVAVGARADLTVLDAPSYVHLMYRPGVPIARVLSSADDAGPRP